MADNQTPKRPHYFKSQFLVLRDFDDEQTFHMEMLRRHNRGLHGWGAVRGGLQVTTSPDKSGILITPGSAVDSLGREIALDGAAVLFFQNNDRQLKWNETASAYELPSKDVAAAAGVTGSPLDVYVTISFQESKSDDPNDQYPPPGGTVDVTRLRQTPLLKVEKAPPDDGSSIKLARVSVDVGGNIGTPDMSVRPQVGCIGPLHLTSADGRPQLGVDYDPQSDALRVRARTKDDPALDATHLTIKRDTGNVGIGTPTPNAKLHVGSGAIQVGTTGDFVTLIDSGITHNYASETNPRYTIDRDLVGPGGAGIGFARAGDSMQACGAAIGIPTSSTLAFYVGDGSTLVERVRLDPSGNIGIGTAPTAARLSIFSEPGPDYKGVLTDYTVGGVYKLSLRFSAPGRDMVSYHFDLTNNLGAKFPDFLVFDRGNVGVGTPAPGSNINTGSFFKADAAGRILDLYSPDHESVLILSSNQDRDGAHLGGLYFTRTGGQSDAHREVAGIQGRQTSTGSLAGGSLYFFTKLISGGVSSDAARMVIRESGRVGIGTTNPLGPLSVGDASVDGSDGYIVIGKRSGGGNRQYRMGFDANYNFVIGDFGNNNTAGAWTSPFAMFWSAPSNSLYIDSGGKVGFGTNAPASNLHLDAPSSGSPISAMSVDVQSFVTAPNAQASHFFRVRDIGGGTTPFYIRGDGAVGIGTTTPEAKLQIIHLNQTPVNGTLILGPTSQSNLRLGYDAEYSWIQSHGGKPLAINPVGNNVGIGTTTPTRAKLEISGGVRTSITGYGFLNRTDPTGKTDKTWTPSYSIWATERIAAVEFNATSDERIKNVRGRSDGALDLQTLLGIEITDYTFKDVVTKGSAPHKKVVGQQVERVFPQAVTKLNDVVPDIYRQAPVAGGWVELATDLQKGERVRLISDGAEGVYEVLEATPDKFRADFEPEGERVFVYGREVPDFRTVDYDAIAMLNVSATQQLKKEKDEEVKSLRAENAGLRSRLDALEAAMQRLLLSAGTHAARPDPTPLGATGV